MKKHTTPLVMLVLACFTTSAFAAAPEFPGTGDKKVWIKACQVYDKALSMRKRGNIDEAMRLYEQAINMYPYDGDFYYNIAIHYARDKKDYARAEDLINKAVALKPDNFNFHWEKAAILIDQNKLAEARGVLIGAQKLKMTDEQKGEMDSVLKQIAERL